MIELNQVHEDLILNTRKHISYIRQKPSLNNDAKVLVIEALVDILFNDLKTKQTIKVLSGNTRINDLQLKKCIGHFVLGWDDTDKEPQQNPNLVDFLRTKLFPKDIICVG